MEDYAHEQVLRALVVRLLSESGLEAELKWLNTRNGHGAVVRELKQLLRDIKRGEGSFPDLIIVATDGNCQGYAARRNEITAWTARVSAPAICAIPDPYIERWLMIDSAAFREVFGKGCAAPNQKCARDRYKYLLREAIRNTGIDPSFGGTEYAADIIAHMDIDRAATMDSSLQHFVSDLRAQFARWRRE